MTMSNYKMNNIQTFTCEFDLVFEAIIELAIILIKGLLFNNYFIFFCTRL